MADFDRASQKAQVPGPSVAPQRTVPQLATPSSSRLTPFQAALAASSPFAAAQRMQGGSRLSGGLEVSPAAATIEPSNRTGLPDRLKTTIEALSHISLDNVRVHRNSARPAQLNALAYAEGTHIHLGPGQERHLPHEAWHVVQQKQGRVPPTLQMDGLRINDDPALEAEADHATRSAPLTPAAWQPLAHGVSQRGPVVQCMIEGHLPAAGTVVFYRIVGAGRPDWIGHLATLGPEALKSLNHVISYHHIVESLTNILNAISSAMTAAAPLNPAPLVDLTESLYTTASAELNAMRLTRAQLVAEIQKVAGGTASGDALTNLASQLEQHLNSSPDNVRRGDASRNMSISSAIDPDFQGDIDLTGKSFVTPNLLQGIPTPAGWAAAGQFGKDEKGGTLHRFRILTPSHNRIVWRFHAVAPPHLYGGDARNLLAIVRNDEKKSARADVGWGEAMSSGKIVASAAAAGAAYPVAIFDPTGAALPITFI